MRTKYLTLPLTLLTAVSAVTLASARVAWSHYLWAEMTPAPASVASAGSSAGALGATAAHRVRLLFVEGPGEKTLAPLRERIRAARLFTPGGGPDLRPAPETNGGDALSSPLPTGARVALASQTWGVLDRRAQNRGVFLLRYWAKAAMGEAEAAQNVRLPVEVLARRDKRTGEIVAEVRQEGWPAPGAEVVLMSSSNTAGPAQTTNAVGEARFALPADERTVWLRAMMAEQKSGKDARGTAYDLVRHYSTLTFPVAAQTTTAQAPAAKPATADPAAYALLEAAHDNRATLGATLGRLSADLVFTDNDGKETTGTLVYTPGTGAQVTMNGTSEEATGWVKGMTANLLGHRRGGAFSNGDGVHPITFAGPDDKHPLGRQVLLHDAMDSAYRVKNNVVTEVTRTAGDERFTITVLETTPTEGGRYLPRHFVVTYFDKNSGAIRRTQSYSDTHQKVSGMWVPVARRVILAENGGFTTRALALRNIRLMASAAAGKP